MSTSSHQVLLPNGNTIDVTVELSLPVVHLLRYVSGGEVSVEDLDAALMVVSSDPDPYLFASGVLLGIWRTYSGVGDQLRRSVQGLDGDLQGSVEEFLELLLSDVPPVVLSDDQWKLMFVLLSFLPDSVWSDFDRFLTDNSLLVLPTRK